MRLEWTQSGVYVVYGELKEGVLVPHCEFFDYEVFDAGLTAQTLVSALYDSW
jgi:hypothetical protein